MRLHSSTWPLQGRVFDGRGREEAVAVAFELPVGLAPVRPMTEPVEVVCEDEDEDEEAVALFGVPPMTVSPTTLVTKTLP